MKKKLILVVFTLAIFFSVIFSGCSAIVFIESVDNMIFEKLDDGGYSLVCVKDSDSKEIVVPDTYKDDPVYEIGEYAFDGCNAASVVIGKNIKSIGEHAFMNCASLTSVDIPASVTEIGGHAFRGCTSLTSVDIPDSVTEISYLLFYECTGLKSVVIPDSVTEIEMSAFYGCTGLKSVTIGENVASIGTHAFQYCTSLEEVYFNAIDATYEVNNGLSSDIYKYDDYAPFKYCGSENGCKLVIGDNVKTIAAYMFYKFEGLSSVTTGQELSEIASYAFAECSKLETIYNNSIYLDLEKDSKDNGYIAYYASEIF